MTSYENIGEGFRFATGKERKEARREMVNKFYEAKAQPYLEEVAREIYEVLYTPMVRQWLEQDLAYDRAEYAEGAKS